jgi:hypothetical protein
MSSLLNGISIQDLAIGGVSTSILDILDYWLHGKSNLGTDSGSILLFLCLPDPFRSFDQVTFPLVATVVLMELEIAEVARMDSLEQKDKKCNSSYFQTSYGVSQHCCNSERLNCLNFHRLASLCAH